MTKRKGPGEYAPGNVDENGNYITGKGRPPESGKFRAGDNRKRGRRQKGTRNLATDLREELETKLTVTVGGKQKRVSRQRAIVMRLADNATKGQNGAIGMALDYQQKLVEPLLHKEAEWDEKAQQDRFDRLTLDELSALGYLVAKMHDLPYNGETPVITFEDQMPQVSSPDATKGEGE